MRIVAVILILITWSAVANATEHLHSLRDMQYLALSSKTIGRPFHIYTMLPESYDEEPHRKYPTIYLLDGGALMPLLAGYYRYLRFTDETQESIIVAISYGSGDFASGNYRSTDYTAPSAERDYWGGAPKFQSFLADELIPTIEHSYRSDESRRIIFGHSLGGQFVLYSARTRPALFWGHIASNPALHRNLDSFMQALPKSEGSTHVIVAGGSDETDVYRAPRLQWLKYWQANTPQSWNLAAVEVAGHTHVSLPPAAFRQGLAWLNAVDSAD